MTTIFDNAGPCIISLGDSGNISLISQIEGSIGGQFSYCLVPEFGKGMSKISFGKDAVVFGPGAVSTPIVSIGPKLYYVVNLKGFSVGKMRFSYGNNFTDSEAEESNEVVKMMIDSGISLTLMPPQFFDNLESAITEAIRLPRVLDPRGKLDLCYRSPGSEIDVPVVTLHFAGGIDMVLKTSSIFVRFAEDLVCVTIKPTDDVPILANFA